MLPVFGHTNPDTDAITSAIVYADLLSSLQIPATAYRLGEPNNETLFVLEKANAILPELLPALDKDTSVALVDHNESTQSVPYLSDLKVQYLIDHHKLGDLTTMSPAYLRFEPVGCTATILYKLYAEHNKTPSSSIALLMLSAILSDTLHFRSPTTTEEDKKAAEELSRLAGVEDMTAYALDMFAAKSDLGDTPAEQLLKMDYKVFSLGQERWGVGVIETTNPAYVFGRKAELLNVMASTKEQDGLHGILLSVVDILAETNQTFVISEREAEVLMGAFESATVDNIADLGNRISRKKQIVPALERYFA